MEEMKVQELLKEVSIAFTEKQEEETRRLVGIEDKDMKEVMVSQNPSEGSSENEGSWGEESAEEQLEKGITELRQLEKEITELRHWLQGCRVHRSPSWPPSCTPMLASCVKPPLWPEVCLVSWSLNPFYPRFPRILLQKSNPGRDSLCVYRNVSL